MQAEVSPIDVLKEMLELLEDGEDRAREQIQSILSELSSPPDPGGARPLFWPLPDRRGFLRLTA